MRNTNEIKMLRPSNFLAMFCIFILASCGPKGGIEPEPKPDPKPDPKPEVKATEFFYKLSSESNAEFMEYVNGNKVKDIQESEMSKHFGKRTQYLKPDSLHIKKDSLFVYSTTMPKKSYLIRWQNDELQTLDNVDKEWKIWAIRNPQDSAITLKINFFNKSYYNSSRSNQISGQQFGNVEKTYLLDLESKENSNLIWLSRNYVFTLIKKK